ncbi:MAG: glycoside hydrolase family 57 protein, partial [Gammaproteobacteria bacterium]|nr:glycoside hydrolase family 57 protein [Gammaproteobacteria bacterium]
MTSDYINFVLCWHMHQPWYQKGIDGEYQLPWVYLHAIKDYADMAAHLEAHPEMKVVVNFAPVLLDQLDDYKNQIGLYLQQGEPMRDPMLNLLSGVTPIPGDIEGRYEILKSCQRAHAPRMIDPYPVFRDLLGQVKKIFKGKTENRELWPLLHYFNDQYFIDVLVWYHLSWLGYSLKQKDTALELMEKGRLFTNQDRRDLLQLIFDGIAGLIPRYRKLAEAGQIELSMTPYGHPIIPLLNDIANMKCAQPDAPVPNYDSYPDGLQRSRWHIEQGIACFEAHFGMRPKGVWLSEGAISEDSVRLLDEFGFQWTASGQGVWHNSKQLLEASGVDVDSNKTHFSPFVLNDLNTRIFFRDDGLSDLIGFEYSKREHHDAVCDFTHHLANIADFHGDKAHEHVVSVILDGENAWEYYPDNAYHFLDQLYGQIVDHKRVRPCVFSELIHLKSTNPLSKLCPGSWVYGSFLTW